MIIEDASKCGQVVELIQTIDSSQERYLVRMPQAPGLWSVPVDGIIKLERINNGDKEQDSPIQDRSQGLRV